MKSLCVTCAKKGAMIDAKDKNKSTPLQKAAFTGELQALKELVASGAFINAEVIQFFSPHQPNKDRIVNGTMPFSLQPYREIGLVSWIF